MKLAGILNETGPTLNENLTVEQVLSSDDGGHGPHYGLVACIGNGGCCSSTTW